MGNLDKLVHTVVHSENSPEEKTMTQTPAGTWEPETPQKQRVTHPEEKEKNRIHQPGGPIDPQLGSENLGTSPGHRTLSLAS